MPIVSRNACDTKGPRRIYSQCHGGRGSFRPYPNGRRDGPGFQALRSAVKPETSHTTGQTQQEEQSRKGPNLPALIYLKVFSG